MISELKEDLSFVFNLLLEQGADVNEVDKKKGNKSLAEYYKQECFAQFFLKQNTTYFIQYINLV